MTRTTFVRARTRFREQYVEQGNLARSGAGTRDNSE
jgi:hypothetical protein